MAEKKHRETRSNRYIVLEDGSGKKLAEYGPFWNKNDHKTAMETVVALLQGSVERKQVKNVTTRVEVVETAKAVKPGEPTFKL